MAALADAAVATCHYGSCGSIVFIGCSGNIGRIWKHSEFSIEFCFSSSSEENEILNIKYVSTVNREEWS